MITPLFALAQAAENVADGVEVAAETAAETVQATSSMLYLDVAIFFAFVFLVIFVGIFMSRKTKEGKESESYFLAGRGLGWCLIGFSLIAANISTEQFVGMSGQASMYLGLAIASYEWMAAVTLVFVAFYFLPQFLKTGIYTIPEFLEKRYNRLSRTIMSAFMAVMLISVSFAAVVYSGAKVFAVFFKDINVAGIPLNIPTLCFVIGFLAMVYVVCGGLKACAWADLLQGSALIVGGAMILYFALITLGEKAPTELMTSAGPVSAELAEQITKPDVKPIVQGWDRFMTLNQDKLRMNLPASDSILPFTALIIGLWIPNFYYWGLNQYVVQRTLGSQSLSQGQKGIIFAAFMKLIIPFVIVFPGIIAFNLFSEDLRQEAGAETQNGAQLATFEDVKSKTGESLLIFDFREDFAELESKKAQEIAVYNAGVAGIAVAEGATPFDIQSEVMQKVNAENTVRNRDAWKAWFGQKSEEPVVKPYDVQKQLVGYDYDSAFPALVSNLIPPGFRGFVLAAILGAVISSLAAVLNAASTIITFDIIKEYFAKNASEKSLVFMGRLIVVIFGITGCFIALFLNNPKFDGIFTYIQKFQGFLSPGILAAFLFGFFARYAPSACGPTALISSPIIYGLLMKFAPGIAFLDSMAITFGAVIAILGFLTAFFPRKEPFVAQGETTIDLRPSRTAKFGGAIVILLTIGLYIYFWQYDWPAFGQFFEDLFFKLLP